MFSEALQLIQDTAVEAQLPKQLTEQRSGFVFAKLGGETFTVPKEPKARSHELGDLDSLAALADEKSAIWHTGNSVVLVFDDSDNSDRLDHAVWKLSTSEKWCAATTQAEKARSQKEFITFLADNLRDEVNAAVPNFIAQLRQVKFRQDTSGHGTVQQGRESMGRSIEAEVTGTADFPETILLNLRRWGGLDFSGLVEFAFRIDPEKATFALKPLADSVETVENEAQKWLGEQIEGAVSCPVYFGKP